MSPPNADQFGKLVSLIKEVKPGLSDTTIALGDSLIESLGLDSLDVLQLSRKVNRLIGTFDLEAWNSDDKRTVQSILEQINSERSIAEPASM